MYFNVPGKAGFILFVKKLRVENHVYVFLASIKLSGLLFSLLLLLLLFFSAVSFLFYLLLMLSAKRTTYFRLLFAHSTCVCVCVGWMELLEISLKVRCTKRSLLCLDVHIKGKEGTRIVESNIKSSNYVNIHIFCIWSIQQTHRQCVHVLLSKRISEYVEKERARGKETTNEQEKKKKKKKRSREDEVSEKTFLPFFSITSNAKLLA